MSERPADRQSAEQQWCGTWFDCDDPGCRNSVLIPSAELAETQPDSDPRFARCVHGIGGSGHQHGHGSCDGPQTDPIISVVRYGGHSRITYRWRGGEVSDEGPAGRTAERLAAIIERGDA